MPSAIVTWPNWRKDSMKQDDFEMNEISCAITTVASCLHSNSTAIQFIDDVLAGRPLDFLPQNSPIRAARYLLCLQQLNFKLLELEMDPEFTTVPGLQEICHTWGKLNGTCHNGVLVWVISPEGASQEMRAFTHRDTETTQQNSGTAAGADNSGDVPEQRGGGGGSRRNPHRIAPDDVADAAKPTQSAFQRHIRLLADVLTAEAVLGAADYIDPCDMYYNDVDNMEAHMQATLSEEKHTFVCMDTTLAHLPWVE
ncbi:hypothetical protein DFH08DRAFT_807188 [Mycena albidolilacea]|uniref:Uncharacterized protein n=1 Tax=Mycena albidolilacea TaxID=1033008 RepID=A0AAD7A666_9AGAR|nr:hypothetical protein DFH08DRAFT_807188 [Mycena albidolilacea]